MQLTRPLLGARRQAQVDAALEGPYNHRVRWLRYEATCTVPECMRRGLTRSLCKQHYNSWWKARKRGRVSPYTPRGPALPEATLQRPSPGHPGAIAWLAGLLEGEGSFGSSRGYPFVKVSMCDRDVIARAADLMVGETRVWERFDARTEERGWSRSYVTAVTGARAAALMPALRPYLGARRRGAIDRALENYAPVRLTLPLTHCTVTECARTHRSRGLCHTH